MPLDTPQNDDDEPQHALGLQHRTTQPSPTGLLQRASRLFTMPQMPSSSTNVTLLNGARHFEVHGHAHLVNAYNFNVTNTHGGNQDLLDIMKPSVSFGALHDSYADDPEHRCHPGAHRYVLKRLQDWIDDVTSTERIFWLHGSAGSGKSAIAHTIADSNGQDKVAATFFFCRSDTDRSNGNRLFMTLAWQLALSIPSIKSQIIKSLNRDPGLPWRSVETQFKELITQPFEGIAVNAASQAQFLSFVVVIDGIDECIDESLQRRILAVIGNAASNVHVPLRFLISSRLEAHIQWAFDQFKPPIHCIDLRYEKLEELVSFGAIHNSRGKSRARRRDSSSCEHTLKQLQSWVCDPSSVERICWLHGPASSGKSAIAQAIADLNEREKVVATFFFHRSDVTRNDGTRLFPTLCWQFANSLPAYKDYIVQYLAKCLYFPRQSVKYQFEGLVVEPFGALKAGASQEQPLDPVVIIDGVDECTDLGIQREFLEVIGNAVRTRRVPLRFLIASRSEARIQETIDRFQCPILSIDLGIVPLDTGTSANPHYNLRITPVEHREGYRYRSPYFGLLPESAIISTFPSNYDFSHQIFPAPPGCKPDRYSRTYRLNCHDGTHADIEKYLEAEFSRIAIKQELGGAWPGQQVIQDFAHKSFGRFIYANTIIRLIGEEGSDAETLLNLIRDLQPRTETLFMHLNELYLEILKWQPDQVFLKDILALMAVRTSTLQGYKDLWKDDAVLMNVSKEELHLRLRRMHSLLDFGSYIDAYHQSFLDFLQQAWRSGQYHISKEEGLKRYLKLITGSLVHYVNNVLNQPGYHEIHHFTPQFSSVIKEYPRRIELSVTEWQEALQPLLKLLKLGCKIFISCAKCTAVRIIRDLLLHFTFLCGLSSIRSTKPTADKAEDFEQRIDVTTESDDSLHNCLSLLLAHLRSPRPQSGPTDPAMKAQICTILYFDCAEIAARIDSVLDAQNLVDVIADKLDEIFFLNQGGPDLERKAILLILEIYARVPVLPRALFLEGSARSGTYHWNCQSSEIEILCQSALIGRVLDKEYIVPVSRICEEEGKFTFVSSNVHKKSMSLIRWRRRANPSSKTVIQVMLGVAKAFQYLHSMGVILHYNIDSHDIFLDSNLSPKIRFFGTFSLYIVKTPSICLEKDSKVLMTREANVFNFGCLFYQMVFNVKIPLEDRVKFKTDVIVKSPTKPEIPDNACKLIQLCCGEDPKRRPTMNEVVEEMKTWSLSPLPGSQDAAPEGPKLDSPSE